MYDDTALSFLGNTQGDIDHIVSNGFIGLFSSKSSFVHGKISESFGSELRKILNRPRWSREKPCRIQNMIVRMDALHEPL